MTASERIREARQGSALPQTPRETRKTFVRVNSRRAVDKLKLVVGEIDWYFVPFGYNGYALIPDEHLAEARKITGVTVARTTGLTLHKCWG